MSTERVIPTAFRPEHDTDINDDIVLEAINTYAGLHFGQSDSAQLFAGAAAADKAVAAINEQLDKAIQVARLQLLAVARGIYDAGTLPHQRTEADVALDRVFTYADHLYHGDVAAGRNFYLHGPDQELAEYLAEELGL